MLITLLFLAVVGKPQAFLSSLDLPVGNAPSGVITGDFNRDGKPDLAVSNQGSSSISILLGIGTGSFRSRRDIALAARPQALASGDFNGDGILDLAVVNGDTNSVSILLGKGDGTFLPPILTPVAGPTALAVADFNQDGKLDLAVGSASSNTVKILLGTGNGALFEGGSFSVGINPVSLAVGDFNSDGRTDIAVANGGSPFISILLGDGRGAFQRSGDVYTGTSLASIAAADLNNDGRLDLAVLTSSGFASPVIILLGHGDATFGEPLRFPVGGNAITYPVPAVGPTPAGLMTIADLNNDGVPDLAVALGSSNKVSVLMGLGDGSFQAFVTFPTGAGPSGVAAADLNDDGVLDIALSNAVGDSVSVLANLASLPRRPLFTQTSIVNGASFRAGPVAPGEIVAIRGSGLGPHELTVSKPLATTLAGTQVFIGGVAAALLYVSSTQIGAVVPLEISGRLTVGVQVDSISGVSNIVVLPVAVAAPGLFSAASSGVGQGAALNQDGSPNSASNPAGTGSVITLFGTGGGQLRNVQVTIGGIAADVLEVTVTASQVFQVQARIPSLPRTGDIPAVLTAGGFASQPGLTIRVQ